MIWFMFQLSLHWLNSKFNEKTIQMNEVSIFNATAELLVFGQYF